MKVMVKDPEKQQYLAPGGGWTANASDADDFIVTTLAYNYARQRVATPFQVILYLSGTNEFIVFAEGFGRALTTLAA